MEEANYTVDEFIQMLLSFPIDPPQSERAGQLEIISDSVYANSSTLDGRRFAQEFYTRRKADSKRSAPVANGSTPSKPTSLADVLKAQPKPQSADLGFKVVKAKGKKKN
jgi:PERQ amino acid-rich with GYF domain-containing protein